VPRVRTTHINLGIELGFDVKTAQTLARRESPGLTMNTYGQANAERLRAAVETLGGVLQTAESKNKSNGSRRTSQPPGAMAAEPRLILGKDRALKGAPRLQRHGPDYSSATTEVDQPLRTV